MLASAMRGTTVPGKVGDIRREAELEDLTDGSHGDQRGTFAVGTWNEGAAGTTRASSTAAPTAAGCPALEAKEARTPPVGGLQQTRFRRRRPGGRPQARRCRVQQSTADESSAITHQSQNKQRKKSPGVWLTDRNSAAKAQPNPTGW